MCASCVVNESALLIRISQYYRAGMSSEELYEVTRGVWVLGQKRSEVRYALAIANGIVQEVYEVKSWHPAGTTPYQTRDKSDVSHPGRWEFVGCPAPAAIRDKYLDKSAAHYFKKGAANPVMYLNT